MKLPTPLEVVVLKKKTLRSFLCHVRFFSDSIEIKSDKSAQFDKCVNRNYVDEHYKSVAKDRSWFHRLVAWLLIRDASLALLHGYSCRHAVLSILVRSRASGHERFFQTDGWSERHSRLHSDVFEAAEPLVQSTVRSAIGVS